LISGTLPPFGEVNLTLLSTKLNRLLALGGYVKQHQVWLDHAREDLDRDCAAHRKLGL
jgi:hypothetical protein